MALEKDDNKIVSILDAKKALQASKDIDLSNPVMTVYGIQQWVDGKIVGTSLYSSQGKASYVKNQLELELKLHVGKCEYKQINYPVY